ncbi:unnamed protein product [Blepharisma stoltei]|uniref:Uncharacterized protein n=1 Tax=Blepharisma stoltei TaxID=1481888 RepID=A0AAU9IWM1_9CILI|nr:unnamed protein product [Blepharisma stoltei]
MGCGIHSKNKQSSSKNGSLSLDITDKSLNYKVKTASSAIFPEKRKIYTIRVFTPEEDGLHEDLNTLENNVKSICVI